MSTTLFWLVLIALVFAQMAAADLATRELTPAGRQRQRDARGTLGYWTQRFQYRTADFTLVGRRYWLASLVLSLLGVLWVVAGVVHGAWR